jgi:hypothetical protein
MIPTGLPAWTGTASFDSYGGHAEKQNYGGGGVIDATTDVGAEDFSRMVSDLAAAVRTADKAIITFLNNDSSPAAPTVQVVRMMTGVSLTSYPGGTPPIGFPSAARNGNGDVTFTFASTYLDEYGVSGTFAITDGSACVHAASNYSASVELVDATHVRVRCFNAGVAVNNQRVTLVLG